MRTGLVEGRGVNALLKMLLPTDVESSSMTGSQLLTAALSVSIQVGESCLMGQGQLKSCACVLDDSSL